MLNVYLANKIFGEFFMNKKKWKKPELKKLKIQNGEIEIKGKLYSLAELLHGNDDENDHDYHPLSKSPYGREIYHHLK